VSTAGSAFSVYSCDDGKSVVAVAKPRSRVFPFYFIVSPQGGEVRLYGEGDGEATPATTPSPTSTSSRPPTWPRWSRDAGAGANGER
jgi:hypothetical protein